MDISSTLSSVFEHYRDVLAFQFLLKSNIEMQGRRAKYIKQSATWEATQAFSSFSFISVALRRFIYFSNENFLEDHNLCVLLCSQALRSKWRQRGSSSN